MPDTSSQTLTASDDNHSDVLLRATALLHKLEIAYVVVMTAVVTWSILRVTRDMILFAVLWGVVCAAAAVTALWPRTPRLLHLLAEAVLLIIAIGQLVGPRHDVLPVLGRPLLRSASRCNELPLTDGRILAWNLIAACVVAWLFPAIAAVVAAFASRRRERARAIGTLFVLAPVWAGLGLIFFFVVRDALF